MESVVTPGVQLSVCRDEARVVHSRGDLSYLKILQASFHGLDFCATRALHSEVVLAAGVGLASDNEEADTKPGENLLDNRVCGYLSENLTIALSSELSILVASAAEGLAGGVKRQAVPVSHSHRSDLSEVWHFSGHSH